MIVTDSSAILAFLLDPVGASNFEEILSKADSVAAPDVIDVEVLNSLRRLERLKVLGAAHARNLLSFYEELSLMRYPTRLLLQGIWKLRHNFSAYDAAYVVVAATLKVPLYTQDAKLHRAGSSAYNIILI